MDATALAKGFPNGVTVPPELQALCAFAAANDGDVSGLFEWETDGSTCARAWFMGDTEAADQFAVFGLGPDGSLYALWLYEGLTASPPIVYLDSEGDNCQVIASDCREFLRLLAIGYDEPGRYPTLAPDNPDSAVALRDWLATAYGLVPPATGEAIVTTAQSQHPDLMAWITERLHRR